jgi:hypothetical protein
LKFCCLAWDLWSRDTILNSILTRKYTG